MLPRQLEPVIIEGENSGKAIIILGPRQVGKTTLLEKIAARHNSVLRLNGDDPFVQHQMQRPNSQQLKRIVGKHDMLFIDEAQRIKDIGITLKIIIDQLKPRHIYVSGSSALELANEINEPLTGRKWEYMLYPVSWQELENHYSYLTAWQQLENRLIYGFYPEVILNPGKEEKILRQLTGSYLYKDLLTYKGIKKPEVLDKLLRALALQVGSEVSFQELGRLVQVDKNTVQSYINLLEKAFVIFRLPPLSRNSRKEISTTRKIYFYDNGVRNALISNYNPLDMRNDTGALWENFLVSERQKFLEYNQVFTNTYFWRSKSQQEIDYIEERNGAFYVYEFKWRPKNKIRFPEGFMRNYQQVTTQVIHQDNFHDFITGEK